MEFTLSVEKTHLAFFLLGLVVVIGVGYAVAQTAGVSHDYSEVTLPAGAWPGLKVDWSNIQGVPAGFADGTDNEGALCLIYYNIHQKTCPSGYYIMKTKPIAPANCAQTTWTTVTFGKTEVDVDPPCMTYGYNSNKKGDVMCCPAVAG